MTVAPSRTMGAPYTVRTLAPTASRSARRSMKLLPAWPGWAPSGACSFVSMADLLDLGCVDNVGTAARGAIGRGLEERAGDRGDRHVDLLREQAGDAERPVAGGRQGQSRQDVVVPVDGGAGAGDDVGPDVHVPGLE